MKLKPEKKFRPERDSNPRPLRYRCSAPPSELSRPLGTGHIVSGFSGFNFTTAQVVSKTAKINIKSLYLSLSHFLRSLSI